MSRLPEADAGLPTVSRLAHTARLAALERATAYTVFATFPGGDPLPAASSLRPVFSHAERQDLDRLTVEAVSGWLERENSGLRAGRHLVTLAHLEPGTVHRLRTYVTACPAGVSRCAGGSETAIVGVTVSLADATVEEFLVIDNARTGTGTWRVPVELDRFG
ncbi:hypothetical protein G1H11_22290 [Phytoactinopolyspora alkaliphila]|uniref:Uncharacterized protein n=1 Tax=Phytoactinopolyspora alkaliphila TaxID=1783498 RepID=A0A6N9YSS2_9ACTN|nr:hypothetical protein [Phytoactinopolyspora alkaliphila]NED98032.1 hypothetical protein [Phytoactinopolyspora alkaliphila]